ncbi:hypothetical protein MPC38_02875 [Prescottella equi]|uniref:hypothetical protein n=1 Tax=Rhodococcus hoagii TaxID=43767 RepID=UPI001F5B1890|nr:hypothetical protein [Prescottella equi]UNQ40225.1 hypothetical protein MPC38_02875 [Prescottella equi]
MRYMIGAAVLAATAALTACSSDSEEPEAVLVPGNTTSATTETVADTPASSPEDQLRETSQDLELGIIGGDAARAWSHYSQRCKNAIGDLDTYKSMMEVFYEDRNPQPTDWIVRVTGSSGQVVTVDADPNAPAHSMEPRTWTFIDGRWQFDNC